MDDVLHEEKLSRAFSPFVAAMRSASLLSELAEHDIAALLRGMPQEVRANSNGRLHLLSRYYGVGAGTKEGLSRRRADRFFMYRSTQPMDAPSLISAIAVLCPELDDLKIAKLGEGDVEERLLSANGQFSKLKGDVAEDAVSLEALFSSVNQLLARAGNAKRFVRLLGDGEREAYVSTNVTSALNLCQGDYLEHTAAEDVMSLAHW